MGWLRVVATREAVRLARHGPLGRPPHGRRRRRRPPVGRARHGSQTCAGARLGRPDQAIESARTARCTESSSGGMDLAGCGRGGEAARLAP